MTHYSFVVEEGAAGERLDVFLAGRLRRARNQAQRLIDASAVKVSGAVRKANYLVQAEDIVEVSQAHEAPESPVIPPDLPVVYEDAAVLVVDKPAGLVTHGADSLGGQASVADFARDRTEDDDPDRPGIVHRLDRDTSGLMIIAKTASAKADLQAQFKQHTIRKTYTLLVIGRLKPEAAVIRLPLGRDEANPLRRAVSPSGKDSITRYTTKAVYPGYSLVEANPETGRTHQIRVHFAAIGHPVAGDTTYGTTRRPLGLSRQFLHASKLTFVTPASGQTITLESPLPPDLATVLHKQLDEA